MVYYTENSAGTVCQLVHNIIAGPITVLYLHHHICEDKVQRLHQFVKEQ